MRRSLGLYRRPSGIYAVRITIPKRLRPYIGKVEIHTSTGYRDSYSAIIAACKIQASWREHLMALDEKLITEKSPLLQTSGTIYLNAAAELIGLDENALLTEIRKNRFPLFVTVGELKGYEVLDIYEVARDSEGFFDLNDVESRGFSRLFSGLMRLYDSFRSASSLIENELTKESTFILARHGGFFIEDELVFTKPQIQLLTKSVEIVRMQLAKHVVKTASNSAPAYNSTLNTPSLPNSLPLVLDPVTAKHGHKKFSELFNQYKKENESKWKEENKRRVNSEIRLFIELMEDPILANIEKDTILDYAQKLAQLPSNTYLAKRKFKVETLNELMGLPEEDKKKLGLKQPETIKNHISKLSEVLNYGVRSHMLNFNPTSEYLRGGSKQVFKKAQDEREIFTDAELHLIFSQTWFKTGSSEFSSNGHTNWRPFYYWLPLLGLLTGARLNEISQLYLQDIKPVEDGETYFVDFNLDGQDKVNADDKSLKTVNSIRVVPVHRVLIELGFIDYVSTLKAIGETRLFPELRHDKVKGYGKAAGSWFNERFLGQQLEIERNGKKTFHSFRHTFLTNVEKLEVQERVLAQLAGHQKGNSESVNRYAKDRSAKELSSIINALEFEFLNQVKPFNVEAGLKALKWAKRIKASIERLNKN